MGWPVFGWLPPSEKIYRQPRGRVNGQSRHGRIWQFIRQNMNSPASTDYRTLSLPPRKPVGPWGQVLNCSENLAAGSLAPSGPHCPSLATSRIASNRRTFSSRYGAASRIVEDVMRLELRYRSDIDLSQPVKLRFAATSHGVCATTPRAARG